MNAGPLEGVRIVEIASLAPAPFGCMLLADLGAEVLRVERANGSPTFEGPRGPLDRGRRTIALDLKTEDGVAALKRVSRDADVFVEGFRPGVAERLGFGPDAMLESNPRLIYARMTGWGQDGPLSQRAGHDINYIAIAGALDTVGLPGERPHPASNLIGDFAGGGAFMALGILAALYERERSGLGQVIDAAMVDGASTLLSFMHGMRAAGMWPGERGTHLLDGGASFYDTYETADGKYVAVGALEPQFYAELLRGLGLPASAGETRLDPSHWEAERIRFREVFATKTRDEWTAIFGDTDGCVTPVLSPWEAHEHPHHVARSSFVEIDGVIQPAPAPRFSRSVPGTPVGMDDGGRNPSASLAAWGLGDEEISALTDNGVVC